MKISKIYVDMDGVLCNFEKRYTFLYGHVSENVRRSEFRANFNHFIATSQFATLDVMDDFQELKKFLDELDIEKQILSSTAYEEVQWSITLQKTHWLNAVGVRWPDPIFVPGKRHKYKYAQPDTIIIDDTYSVIEDWEKAGGIAIHHRDTSTTLMHLKSILGA